MESAHQLSCYELSGCDALENANADVTSVGTTGKGQRYRPVLPLLCPDGQREAPTCKNFGRG